jgi:signal transduction histidine kinase
VASWFAAGLPPAHQKRTLPWVKSPGPAAEPSRVWRRYFAAGGLTVLVVAGRLALDPWWGRQHNRHLVFLPTVMLAAWLGGLGPGLLSATISTVALATFWTEPVQGLSARSELVLFFCVSAAICALIQSLHVARARADAARRSREQVLAVVVHDLRNPLSAVRVAAEALLRDPSHSDVVRRRLSVIDRASLRMEHLIRDLVDAAHIEHGELAMTIRQENVQSIVQEAIDLHAPLAREGGVTLEAEVTGRDGVIDCDRNRLLQVLGNLLGNALRFTAEGGRITLRTDHQESRVRFVVDDTGTGIRPEDLPHVFEQYWHSDAKGTGPGLYIARNIVGAHGGEIGVHSEPGRGASFFFTVPTSPGPAAPAA